MYFFVYKIGAESGELLTVKGQDRLSISRTPHPGQVVGRGGDEPMAQEGALVRDYLDKSTHPIPLLGS